MTVNLGEFVTGTETGVVLPQAPAIGGTALRGLRENYPFDAPVQWRHLIPEEFDDVVPFDGTDAYATRALPVSLVGDTVQLPDWFAPDVAAITEHYRRAGIESSDTIVFNTNPLPGRNSVFMFGGVEHSINPNERRLYATAILNDKNRFVELAERQGWAVPPTVVRYGGAELGEVPFDGPYFVKEASISGSGVTRCESLAEAEKVVAGLREAGKDYQVQQSVGDDFVFLNIQYNIENGTAEFVATTEQVLAGFAHNGNKYPSRYDPRAVTDPVAKYAAQAGVEAIMALDVAVNLTNPEIAYIIDPNIRPNGSSYPTAVAERLGVDEWSCFNVPIREGLDLETAIRLLGDIEYNPGTGRGVVIVNPGIAKMHKLGLFFAGPEAEQQLLIAQVQERLG